ncbi:MULTISPECIES: hypothetical protein [unclassified Candidatus Tisiphia]
MSKSREEIIVEMQQKAAELVKTCSANNVVGPKGEPKRAAVEEYLSYFNEEINEYFKSKEVSVDLLLDTVYIMQVLASCRMYYDHNGEKAREILLSSKKLAEQYVLNKSAVPFDFNS